MPRIFRVNFESDGREVDVPEGTTVLEAAIRAGVTLNSPCGGKGTCGGCMVHIPDDTPEVTEAGIQRLSREELQRNLRLACQVRVVSDMRVLIPAETRLHDEQILVTGIEHRVEVAPAVHKVHLQLTEPSITDQRADSERLLQSVAVEQPGSVPDVRLVRELPERMRKFQYNLTATIVGNRIVQVERGDTSEALYGIAFDIGTTTVVGLLIDLMSGRQLAVASRTNPQSIYGDDVVARIEHTTREPGGLKKLNTLIIDCVNEIIDEVCSALAIKPTSIYEAVAVGNTTMIHLFLRLPVSNIGQAPYIAALSGGLTISPRDIGLKINPRGQVYTAPNISGYLGADMTSVVLAAAIHRSDKLTLAIDIGTNGEIILGNSQRMIACSTAAGPAFEGARIQYGMRASNGSIDRVDIIDDEVRMHIIGEVAPVGLCGTGLIDAVAELLTAGIILNTGAFIDVGMTQSLPGPLRQRLRQDDGQRSFVLATPQETETGNSILLTQRDIREVQLAKGAILAGISTLVSEMSTSDADIEQVLLAGAFGTNKRAERAIRVGLL
ncbi:MAG: ASKHA domain-containing protein, partial [Planctomycetia bacterium]|nr:ASKHA domain-containing protein [Planctomycetia bacterium]